MPCVTTYPHTFFSGFSDDWDPDFGNTDNYDNSLLKFELPSRLLVDNSLTVESTTNVSAYIAEMQHKSVHACPASVGTEK